MKKQLSVVLAAAMAVSMTACGGSSKPAETTAAPAAEAKAEETKAEETKAEAAEAVDVSDFKVGLVFIGDENEGYTAAHYEGAKAMQKKLGLSDDQVIIKWNIPEDETCYDAAVDLADQGCKLVIANSFGHEDYIKQAAEEFPDVEFCHATGFQAASSGLDNFHNFFTNIYESRYVSGVVAGMKLNEMMAADSSIDPKIGYIGAFPYAEVISGFTSFFLGVRSVCPEAHMEVQYTNSWASFDLEKECAEALIADGCVLISQHADTTGGPTACEAAGVPCVGYNISMIATAPTQALTSASMDWGIFYTYAAEHALAGEKFAPDWCEGYATGADKITELNDAAIAEGTKEKVAEVEAAIVSGDLKVFATDTFTVDGKALETFESNGVEYVADGYFHESEFGSAPAFSLIIDGIDSQS